MSRKLLPYRPEVMSFEVRAQYLSEQLLEWIRSDRSGLKEAIQATEQQTSFRSQDIQHSVHCLEEQLSRDDLTQWVQCLGLGHSDAQPEQEMICCIHAGNLPMVGLQDVLAVLLSGHIYVGKLSTKDPFLLASLLEFLSKGLLAPQIQSWSTQTIQPVTKPYDRVLFAGSEESLSQIQYSFSQSGQSTPATQWLNRTASFSLYWCDTMAECIDQIDHLLEAMFRYHGKGCRSVGVVAAPFGLNNVADTLMNAFNQFEEKFPVRSSGVKYTNLEGLLAPAYQQAYYTAVQRDFIVWGHWSIASHPPTYAPIPQSSSQIYWLDMEKSQFPSLLESYGNKLQTVYTAKGSDDTEPLYTAQCPPLYWKPDGRDTLEFLTSNTIGS